MMAISLNEFIFLLPILILGCAIIVLLFMHLLFRISTKTAAIIAIASLLLALSSSFVISYNIISYSKSQTNHITTQTHDENNVTISTADTASDKLSTNSPSSAVENVEHAETSAQETLTNQVSDNNAETVATENTSSMVQWKATYVTALFTCDLYGLLYTSLILIVCIIVAILANDWFGKDQSHSGLFYLILLFSALGGATLVYSSHLISLFLGVELLSIPMVGLIGYQYTQKYSLEAAAKYMVLSVVASAFLLLGIAFYYAATGELTFSGLSFKLSILTFTSPLLLLGVCLMLVGIGFKLSLVPFQLWLPDVYQGAPACVSLLLTTVCKVAIFCAVARLFLLAPIVNNETIRIIMIVMSFGSILWGNIFAITQRNIKRLLSYTSISHFGYLLIALIAVQYQVLSLETIGVYLIGYVLANICILGVVSLESCAFASEDQDNDIDLQGLFWRRPVMALAMGVGLLSLAGVPLTIGFIGRFALVLLGVTAELWWLIGAVVIGSAFELYLCLKLTVNLYIKPINAKKVLPKKIINFSNIRINEAIIVLTALLILLCGIYPKWLFNLVTVSQYLMS